MRTMMDSTNPAGCLDGAQLYAGYIDGSFRSFAGMVARFPGAIHVPIAVHASTNDGLVLDIERGDATPAQGPGWCSRRRAAGVVPSVYCSLSEWPAVRAAFRSAGVPEPEYWIAAYPGNGPNLYAGSVAHQYGGGRNPATGGLYDVSAVADHWPGVDTGPAPPGPTPRHREDETMIVQTNETPARYYELTPYSSKLKAVELSGQTFLELSAAGAATALARPPLWIVGRVVDALRADGQPHDAAAVTAAIDGAK